MKLRSVTLLVVAALLAMSLWFVSAAPPDLAGSLMTLQTALGFALTFATVQLTPLAADRLGWPAVLAALAVGPALGIWAMLALRRERAGQDLTTAAGPSP
jgi:dipeptide/tripeptide permease